MIHGQIKGLNPQELVALPGHPEVTVPFDDLIKDEGEGVSTTRATLAMIVTGMAQATKMTAIHPRGMATVRSVHVQAEHDPRDSGRKTN